MQVRYDPTRISYEKLLDVFWRNIDPLSANRQFCDRGRQYQTAAARPEVEGGARWAVRRTDRHGDRACRAFYPAEEYHQDYYKKNPLRYKLYRWNCGRDARLAGLWDRTLAGRL